MTRFITTALACSALWAALPALAQTATAPPPGERLDPLDASAPVPSALHRPALREYRRITDNPAVPWREANDQVERIGGWRAYAREAAAAARAAASPASAPAPGHSGHTRP